MAAYWTGNIVKYLFLRSDAIIYSLIYTCSYFHGFPIMGDACSVCPFDGAYSFSGFYTDVLVFDFLIFLIWAVLDCLLY